ncbi:MAG: fibrinogen-like YCDxxxxGGGW domain-containing protein, partial [Myxococcota bacterium]|nr:fibrinogen-like YCDxxxxGGGW domain-containing protein [Myxococcota bacterium]
ATALFVNGEAVDSAPTEPLLFDGTEQLWMGNQADHADELRQFQGDVYSARLSSTVKYDGPFVPKPALGAEVDTIAYWDFSGVSPTTVPDASGQGHDGTRVGGTVVGGCPLAVDGAVCGDDVVAPWEECDDGNTEDDDGCSAACEFPVTWLSCKHLLDSAPETPDGAYWIDPDAAGPVAPVRCFCDMTGGGWTLVGNYYDTPGDDMPNDTAYVVGGWEQMDSGQWADTATTVDRNAGPSAGVALAFVEALGAVGGQANLKICFIEEEGGDAPCRSSADGSLTLVSYDAGNPKLSPYSDDPLPYTYGRLAGLAGGADGYGAGVLEHKVACIPVTPSSNTILPG